MGAYLLAVYSRSSASIHWHAWHIFPRADCRKNWLVILLPMPVLIAILPNIIAVESAWHAMQAKLSLREQGGLTDGVRHTLRVQPGIDRIVDGLRDHRRTNLISRF